MSNKNPYQAFNKFILRTPLYSLDFYKNFTKKTNLNDEDFLSLINDPVLREAIYIASPVLYNAILKWINKEETGKGSENPEKLKLSILKYISRLSSRCTPFGLFAGCTIGNITSTTNIVLNGATHNKRHTRFDMNYLVALSQNLSKLDFIKNQLLFRPNKSMYEVADKIRYIEYYYTNGRRNHQVVSISNSKHIKKIIEISKKGALINDIANEIVSESISHETATNFIEELINNQVLISNLEPSVTGIEFYNQIILIIEKLNQTESVLDKLHLLKSKLIEIDENIGNNIEKYKTIIEILKDLNTEFDLSHLFQTDMSISTAHNTLNISLVNSVRKGMSVLNKFSHNSENATLLEFKKRFYTRYENQEIQLSKVLDSEIGIGYHKRFEQNTTNPLIDDLSLPETKIKNSSQTFEWNPFNSFFHKKILQANKNNNLVINITQNELSHLDENWLNLPDTISTIIELVIIDKKEKVKFSGIGGSSAANLLGRFCHSDIKINEYVNTIIETENNINEDSILAEIIHLPESRVGNILMRPSFRNFEIPYLGNSTLGDEFQISIDDLYISIKNDKLVLRSKKHNRKVIPRLTNAHNYSQNSLPIYHFLCDFQLEGKRQGMSFNLGSISNTYDFIPRIEYEDVILYEATWNIEKKDIESLIKNINNQNEFILEIENFRKIKKIPLFAVLVENDNELLINFNNLTSVKMLIDIVRKKSNFILKEFLHAEKSEILDTNKEYYSNEIILSFFNNQKLSNNL
ncbi:MAG: lantibiotic dehydratase family protein [Flavobacterium sp.]|uniref:lantibiotic dehydratase family protein n=1 Tax=Flavobacterium sp. TaxID=239 RepID=UPI001B14AD69|nr:lantibiotic dehydratase family protein [Flavobacterium sp.]MBO9586969.1 lantibiotic dehydratase family protein [Flavobacterium sp.]